MATPSASVVGLFTGLLLALGILMDGFFGFVLLALFGTIGLLVGRVLDGQIDVSGYLTRGRSQ